MIIILTLKKRSKIKPNEKIGWIKEARWKEEK